MQMTKGIGVISTIKYIGTNLEANFRRGVDNEPWWRAATPLDSIGYDNGPLDLAVDQFNKDANVGLIVTVGGVASAIAAKRRATKPFISLIGDKLPDFPGTIDGNFYGGVSLNTFRNNDARVDHLSRPPHRLAPSEICLLSNPRSVYAAIETGLWLQSSPRRGDIITASTIPEITQAFAKFVQDGTLRAMIISADGFFQENKDFLIDKANASNKRVCYPFQIFANTDGAHKPTGGRHTLHGPKLATAYFTLGQKAAQVISSNGSRSTLDTAQDAGEFHDN
jgi:hypothetical protein